MPFLTIVWQILRCLQQVLLCCTSNLPRISICFLHSISICVLTGYNQCYRSLCVLCCRQRHVSSKRKWCHDTTTALRETIEAPGNVVTEPVAFTMVWVTTPAPLPWPTATTVQDSSHSRSSRPSCPPPWPSPWRRPATTSPPSARDPLHPPRHLLWRYTLQTRGRNPHPNHLHFHFAHAARLLHLVPALLLLANFLFHYANEKLWAMGRIKLEPVALSSLLWARNKRRQLAIWVEMNAILEN